MSPRALALVVLAGVLVSACDVHGVSAPGALSTITVTPNATIAAAGSMQMIAVGRDADGRVIAITPVWSVAGSGGTINAAGMYSAGTVTGLFSNSVMASVGLVSGTASITVIPGSIASIAVTPTAVTLGIGTAQQFFAVARDISGNGIAITPTWSVVAGGGTINEAGVFTAGAVSGAFANTVQASNNGVTAFASVTVSVGALATLTVSPNPATLMVGATQLFTAVGKDASGNIVQTAVVWSVAAGGGSIAQTGLFTASGTAATYANTVVATAALVSGNASVVVIAGALASVTVTPNPSTMQVSGTQQFAAVGKDAGGNIIAITPAWAVVTPTNGARITPAGLYTAGTAAGTFVNNVRATSGGISGFATIIAISGPLASITVTPNPVSVLAGGMQKFIAVGNDANGNVFLITPVWSVVNGGGSINSSTGIFIASAAAGTFGNSIQATSGNVSGTATVTVTSAPIVGVVTTFENFSVGEIDGQQDWQSFGGFGAPPPVNPINTHCAVYDQVIADNTAAAAAYMYPTFGSKSLRISNAVTSGCYGDQTFSSRTANPAGQTGAWSTSTDGSINYALAGGVLQNHFEAEWSFASTVPNAQQPGLQVVVSPARGDDSRMSWVQMTDLPNGLAVIFGEWASTAPGGTAATGAPLLTTVAQGLDRHVPHTIEISMTFLDGPNNDVVQLYVDGILTHTGTSWENYYAYQAGGLAKFGGAPPIVNRLMFRTGSDLIRGIPGDPAPATLGHGFVFDNLRQATFMVAPVAAARLRLPLHPARNRE